MHEVRVVLHPEVTASVKVNVARSPEEADLQAQGIDVMAQMFERDTATFTEEFDPNAEPGTVPADLDAGEATAEAEAPVEADAEAEAPVEADAEAAAPVEADAEAAAPVEADAEAEVPAGDKPDSDA